jgi:protein O-mannosyl-transferase
MQGTELPVNRMLLKSPKIRLFVLCSLIALSSLVFFPGISGPYVFDDYSNLLNNSFVQVKSLDIDELKNASYSLAAGPLKRPVAMLSFALNHYFAGSFERTAPFKLVNLLIHALNGLLVFWLARLVFVRLGHLNGRAGQTGVIGGHYTLLLAAVVALLWVIHPMQLTSVLYIVQRMTLLSGFFVLLALTGYLQCRQWIIKGRRRGAWLIILALLGGGTLGMLSKENAILLPVFVLAIEFVLFPNERPWWSWNRVPPYGKKLVLLSAAMAAGLLLAIALQMAQPGYVIRDFSMTERLMTEPRVLFFYVSLILVPRINEFGLLHDDIEISRSLISPWTTLPSLLTLAALLGYAIYARRRQPLLSLGILWFFGAHLLESTIFPLEIAHEHRNYLAVLGILFVIVHLLDRGSARLGHLKLWGLIPLMALVFAGTSYARATQWGDINSLYRYEAIHHPQSAGAQAGLSTLLNTQGDYKGAIDLLRRASELNQREAAFLMGMHWIAAKRGETITPEERQETLRRLAAYPVSSTAGHTLNSINECILNSCRGLQQDMETWMRVLLEKEHAPMEASFYYYLLGRASYGQGKLQQSIDAFIASHQTDPVYLHPLLELGAIYVRTGKTGPTEKVLALLQQINSKHRHPQDEAIKKLEEMLARAKLNNTADDRR